MSIENRILTQVMLRGCKYRVATDREHDTINVPIPIQMTAIRISETDHRIAESIAMERLVILKQCAQAYIDLYTRVTDMAGELKEISNLARDMRQVSISDLYDTVSKLGGKAWHLEDMLRRFIEDEMVADRKDYPV